MENLYQIPSESCDDAEQRIFWAKVTADQIASGMGAEKFCQHHQVNFSKFHYWKYSKIRLLSNNTSSGKQEKRKRDKSSAKFIPLQITTDIPSNKCHKKEVVSSQAKEVVVIFKNGHKIILPLVVSETNLSLLVEIVGGLQC